MWRYRDVLPAVEPVTLGEGWTPMLPSRRYANVFLKEEGANPTGTFKARGLSMAISMLRFYGVKKVAVPSAGNATALPGELPRLTLQQRESMRTSSCPRMCRSPIR